MKTCSVENCFNPVWGKGFCRSHQHLRTDKKPKKPSFYSKREKIEATSFFGYEDQRTMFEDLWEKARNNNGRVICQFTGLDITDLEGTSFWVNCFAHVLPKGRFIYFKLNPDNIRVVAPLFHQLVDVGTARQREKRPDWKWEEWYNLVSQMKERYAQFKKERMLR